MDSTKATAGVAWMLLATVLYTAANLCVKALAHLPTQELVFLRSIVSLLLTGGWLWWKGYPLLGVNRKWLLIRGINIRSNTRVRTAPKEQKGCYAGN